MTKKIVTLTKLAEMVGRHRNQLYTYLEEKGLKPQYTDENGRKYWSEKTALEIVEAVREAKADFHPGRGKKIEILGLKRKRKSE